MKYVAILEQTETKVRRILAKGSSEECNKAMSSYIKLNNNVNERVYVTLEKQYLKEITPVTGDGNKQILMET